jgi:uncharacterized protein YjbI with pentapeptide repeats
MPNTSLCNCNINHTDFDQTDLTGSLLCQESNEYSYNKVDFLESNFKNIELDNLIMNECELNHLDFSDSALHNIKITNSNIKYTQLKTANINELNICNSVSLKGTSFPANIKISDLCNGE